MKYHVQGFNHLKQQWETLPYWLPDGTKHTEYPLEHMAVNAMWQCAEEWPNPGPGGGVMGYRVIPSRVVEVE